MQKFNFESKAQIQNWVHGLVKDFKDKQIVLLSGQMGAGKTQLTHYFLEALKSEEIPSSPTFALHQEYKAPDTAIHHFDLWRLEDEEDLESSGFWDIFELSKGVILIEWADRLDMSFLPVHWNKVNILLEVVSPDSEERKVTLS